MRMTLQAAFYKSKIQQKTNQTKTTSQTKQQQQNPKNKVREEMKWKQTPYSSSNPMNELEYLHLPPMVPSSPL